MAARASSDRAVRSRMVPDLTCTKDRGSHRREAEIDTRGGGTHRANGGSLRPRLEVYCRWALAIPLWTAMAQPRA